MSLILCGLETEYGLYIEGRGAEEQIDDAMTLVRSYPSERRVIWDYRFESPRADLRGFSVDRLQFDPEDAKFDSGQRYRGADAEVRSDIILPNGARFYNDHGHPEYATPECWSVDELVAHDLAGQVAVFKAAQAHGKGAKVYKNNTDFHGASYGTHESYLVPRSVPIDRLFRAVLPLLVVRPILCGAGKVGAETGRSCAYQMSQRADFFSEAMNVETLFRRPIFNTRDEPHADPNDWIRLHVIAGDANMIPACTKRKVALLKMAIRLAEIGEAPAWEFKNPVESAQTISRNESRRFEIPLAGNSWTNAYEVFESYFAAADRFVSDPEVGEVVAESRRLLKQLNDEPAEFAYWVDWAAKKALLEQVLESGDLDWNHASLPAYDLEYHNVDSDESLYWALAGMGSVQSHAPAVDRLTQLPFEPTRARARGLALRCPELKKASWGTLTFEIEGKERTIALDPARDYGSLSEEATAPQIIDFVAQKS